jgi:xanthine phosphoribosyltransferase
MKLLEERILAEGKVSAGDILRVDSFINHRIDVSFSTEMAKEVKRLFSDTEITLVLTVEASGISIATLVAQQLGVPLVFAKKHQTTNLDGALYSEPAWSYTHQKENNIVVSKEYINAGDKVLLVDDFLARGAALSALAKIVEKAGATVAGAAVVIEKEYQGGGNALRAKGYRVEALAKILKLSEDGIVFG